MATSGPHLVDQSQVARQSESGLVRSVPSSSDSWDTPPCRMDTVPCGGVPPAILHETVSILRAILHETYVPSYTRRDCIHPTCHPSRDCVHLTRECVPSYTGLCLSRTGQCPQRYAATASCSDAAPPCMVHLRRVPYRGDQLLRMARYSSLQAAGGGVRLVPLTLTL